MATTVAVHAQNRRAARTSHDGGWNEGDGGGISHLSAAALLPVRG
jgi:hypothetical protein